MRSHPLRALPILALVLAACAPGDRRQSSGETEGSPAAAGDRLVLGGAGTLLEVNAGTGALILSAPDGSSAGDGTGLFATRSTGGSTVLESLDPATGHATDVATLRGTLVIRSVSRDGTNVALTAPMPPGYTDWAPPPSRTTDIAVVNVADGSVHRLHLRGNYQPESFSVDDETLFMLSYEPPMAPTLYRVMGVYIEKARVVDVFGPKKQPVENMTATRLQQVAAPDGSALYTLYSNQPPAYLAGNGATTAEPDERAFVHTLRLSDSVGFAVCIRLPDVFGTVPAPSSAIAVSPDGTTVYAIDAMHGDVASVTVERQKVKNASVDLTAVNGDRTAATTSIDGRTLFVGGGGAIVAVDLATMSVRDTWQVGGSLTDLALSPDGRRLYVSFPDHVAVLSATTGHDLGSIGTGGETIEGVAAG
jgi:hypothetical protein